MGNITGGEQGVRRKKWRGEKNGGRRKNVGGEVETKRNRGGIK